MRTARRREGGLVQPYKLGPAVQVIVVQHLLGRKLHAARIGDIAVQVGKRQLHGLDLDVLGLHRIDRNIAPIEALANTQTSEEHTSELQSLMRISYAVFCLKKKNNT